MTELLDHEEALALQGIVEALQRAGEGLAEAAALRSRIRRHPWLATGLSACAGFVGGPILLRLSARLLGATATGAPAHARRAGALPVLAMTALRIARARR